MSVHVGVVSQVPCKLFGCVGNSTQLRRTFLLVTFWSNWQELTSRIKNQWSTQWFHQGFLTSGLADLQVSRLTVPKVQGVPRGSHRFHVPFGKHRLVTTRTPGFRPGHHGASDRGGGRRPGRRPQPSGGSAHPWCLGLKFSVSPAWFIFSSSKDSLRAAKLNDFRGFGGGGLSRKQNSHSSITPLHWQLILMWTSVHLRS